MIHTHTHTNAHEGGELELEIRTSAIPQGGAEIERIKKIFGFHVDRITWYALLYTYICIGGLKSTTARTRSYIRAAAAVVGLLRCRQREKDASAREEINKISSFGSYPFGLWHSRLLSFIKT